MSASTFLDTLRMEVARMQAVHPEREAELARAHALILHGMVVPSPDDPETGQVLSSDGQKVYHVNGVCDCDAGQHVHGWRLYQYVQRKLDAQATQTAQEPLSAPQTPVDTSAAVVASTPLPEAPASVNVHILLEGRQVQLTLRDTDETRLLQRLAAVLQQYPAPAKPATQGPKPGQDKGWCAIPQVQMKENRKDDRTWYSHRVDGQFCKGKGVRP